MLFVSNINGRIIVYGIKYSFPHYNTPLIFLYSLLLTCHLHQKGSKIKSLISSKQRHKSIHPIKIELCIHMLISEFYLYLKVLLDCIGYTVEIQQLLSKRFLIDYIWWLHILCIGIIEILQKLNLR